MTTLSLDQTKSIIDLIKALPDLSSKERIWNVITEFFKETADIASNQNSILLNSIEEHSQNLDISPKVAGMIAQIMSRKQFKDFKKEITDKLSTDDKEKYNDMITSTINNLNEIDDLSEMVDQYLETALWSSTDMDSDKPMDDLYGIEDFSEEARKIAIRDCSKFLDLAGDLVIGEDLSQMGHNFWLTRNGHGAGFWDGDYEKEKGDKLTEISKKFGVVDIEVNSDTGKLEFFGGKDLTTAATQDDHIDYIDDGTKHIAVTYETVSPESREEGDFESHGFYDVEYVDDVSEAIKYMKNNGASEPNGSFSPDILWYSTTSPDQDLSSGEETFYNYHPKNFSEEEQRQIYDALTGVKASVLDSVLARMVGLISTEEGDNGISLVLDKEEFLKNLDDDPSMEDIAKAIDYEMEHLFGNSQYSWVNPADVDALTDADMFGDVETDDQGNIIKIHELYWYPQYMISDWKEELFKNGRVFFTSGLDKSNVSSELEDEDIDEGLMHYNGSEVALYDEESDEWGIFHTPTKNWTVFGPKEDLMKRLADMKREDDANKSESSTNDWTALSDSELKENLIAALRMAQDSSSEEMKSLDLRQASEIKKELKKRGINWLEVVRGKIPVRSSTKFKSPYPNRFEGTLSGGLLGDTFYSFSVEGVDPTKFNGSQPEHLEEVKKLRNFKSNAQRHYLHTERGGSMAAKKKALHDWLREFKPSQYYVAYSPKDKDTAFEVYFAGHNTFASLLDKVEFETSFPMIAHVLACCEDGDVDCLNKKTQANVFNFENDVDSRIKALVEFMSWTQETRIENDANDPEYDPEMIGETVEDQLTGIAGQINGHDSRDLFKDITSGLSDSDIKKAARDVGAVRIKDGWIYYDGYEYKIAVEEFLKNKTTSSINERDLKSSVDAWLDDLGKSIEDFESFEDFFSELDTYSHYDKMDSEESLFDSKAALEKIYKQLKANPS